LTGCRLVLTVHPSIIHCAPPQQDLDSVHGIDNGVAPSMNSCSLGKSRVALHLLAAPRELLLFATRSSLSPSLRSGLDWHFLLIGRGGESIRSHVRNAWPCSRPGRLSASSRTPESAIGVRDWRNRKEWLSPSGWTKLHGRRRTVAGSAHSRAHATGEAQRCLGYVANLRNGPSLPIVIVTGGTVWVWGARAQPTLGTTVSAQSEEG
jgi:hypothetical protein